MQFLLDHLTSALVGGVVMMVLLAVGARMSDGGRDTQLYETSRRQSQAFAQQLEHDLLNVGYGVPTTSAPIQEWTDSTFVFLRKLDTLSTAPVVEVAYRRATVDSVEVRGQTVALYEVQRFQDDVRSGGSPPTLTGFRIGLVDRAGAATTDLAAAIGIAVGFRNAWGGAAADHTGSAARYDRTFYPANLDD